MCVYVYVLYESVCFTDHKIKEQREILVQGHIANKWQSQLFNTNLCNSTAHVLCDQLRLHSRVGSECNIL